MFLKNNKRSNIKNNDTKYTSINSDEASASTILSTNKGLIFPLSSKENLQSGNILLSNNFPSNNSDKINKSNLSAASKNSTSLSSSDLSFNGNTSSESIIKPNQNNDLSKNVGSENNQDQTAEKLFMNNSDNVELLKYEFGEKKTDLASNKNLLDLNNIDNTTPELKPLTSGNKSIKFHKKRNENISWSYFANPVVSSVRFIGKEIKAVTVTSFSPTLAVNSKA